jgi:dipeptidyl aminopeptidase/acylaminoacyl peptidase
VLFNVSTGAERTLGKGRFSAISVSPDGRWIATLRHSRPHQLADVAQNPNQFQGVKHTLRIYSLRGDEQTVCDECSVVYNMFGSITWSSDSRFLNFFARSWGEPVEAGRYYRLRLDDFELRTYAHPDVQVVSMAESDGMLTMPTPAFQIGPDIVIYGRTRKAGEPTMSRVTAPHPGPRGRADWYLVSADGTVKNLTSGLEGVAPSVVYADGNSFVVPAAGKLWRLSGSRPAENLTTGIADPVAPAGAAAGSPTLSLMATGAARRALSFDVISGKYAAVEFPSATAELKGITRDGTALFVDSTTTGTSLEIRGSEGKIFADLFNTHRREITPPRWQPISYTYKGKDLTSCVLLPNDYVAGRRYPAVFSVYRVPSMSFMSFCRPAGKPLVFQGERGSDNIDFLATRGYVIVYVASLSELVFEDGDANKGLGGLVDAALDAAARAGYVDPERAGVFGVSNTGFSALQVATQSNRFRAISAGHIFANLISAWGETSIWQRYRVEMRTMGFGPAHAFEQDGSFLDLNGPPWSNLKGYIANSPVLNAVKITAAMQLIATDMDVVSDTQLQEMLSALYRQNKEAEMITYFGENHWLASPANWTDAWKRIEAFFDRYLKAPAPPQ